MKRLSFITQFKIEFLLPFSGCRKVLGKMPVDNKCETISPISSWKVLFNLWINTVFILISKLYHINPNDIVTNVVDRLIIWQQIIDVNVYDCYNIIVSLRPGNGFLIEPITAQCCLSIPLENIKKPKGFLMFSGGIDKQHRAVMG